MTIRKTVGWVVFVFLLGVLLFQAPRVAADACYMVGARFYAAGNYKAAAGAFSGAIRLYPQFARGYVELGSSYLKLKKYALAEEAFVKAKSIDDESCASCGLGMTYNLMGRYDDAEKEFQRAESLNPNDVCAYDQSGRMYYDRGMYPEAIAAFKQAVTLSPTLGRYMFLANSYVYARQFETSVGVYKQAIQLDPKDLRAHIQLGIAYDCLQQYENAAAEYEQAVKLDPKDEKARYHLVLAYTSLGRKEAARAQYESLRKLDPETAAGLVDEGGFSQPRQKGKEKLYFVPIGSFSAASLTKLANYCKKKTGVEATLVQPVPFALSTIDKQRRQVIAEEAIELIKLRYPNLAADPNAIVIGLTDEDMYIRKYDWQFAFTYRKEARFAIVATARMNPVNLGQPANDTLLESRMRKMVMKDIGLLYYLFTPNHNPGSVLFDEVNGIDDLDRMSEDF